MRFPGVVCRFSAVLISISLLLNGCQAGSRRSMDAANAPSPSSRESVVEASPASASEQRPYFNPSFRDNDYDDQMNPVLGFFVAAGAGAAGAVWAVVTLPFHAIKFAEGDRPSQAVRMMEDSSSADNRRAGINKLMEWDFARHDPYTRRFRQIAQFDTDPTVKATAIRALNRARDLQATKVFIAALGDPNDWVRLEGAKALANVPDMAAADPLLQLLNRVDENRDVRVAAADALKHCRTLAVARGLVGVLADRHFGVSWQARKSLRYLFSRDFGYDQAAWLAYLSGPASPVK